MKRLTTAFVRPVRRALLVAAFVAGLYVPVHLAVGAADAGEPAGCLDSSLPLTVEEQRLTSGAGAVGRRLVQAGGFGHLVDDFRAQLCAISSMPAASAAVTHAGARLWQAAVDRAQGRTPAAGTLDEYDDRSKPPCRSAA